MPPFGCVPGLRYYLRVTQGYLELLDIPGFTQWEAFHGGCVISAGA